MCDFSHGLPWLEPSSGNDDPVEGQKQSLVEAAPTVELVDPGKPLIFTMNWKRELEFAFAALVDYEHEIDVLIKETEGFEIKDEGGKAEASDRAGKIGKLLKSYKDEQTRTTKPAWDFKSTVDKRCKPLTDKMTTLKKGYESKITLWDRQQENERRRKQALADQAAAELNAKMEEVAQKEGFEPVKIDAPVVAPAPTKMRTEHATVSVKEVWKCEVVDFALLPDQYKVVNQKLLDEVTKAGTREIPGCRIWAETESKVRAR